MEKVCYPAVFTKLENEYVVEFPDIDGCITGGSTLEKAKNMAFDAMGLCIQIYREDQRVLPQTSNPNDITLKENQTVEMIEYTDEKYNAWIKENSVEHTITLPKWLSEEAAENGLDLTEVLINALYTKLEYA